MRRGRTDVVDQATSTLPNCTEDSRPTQEDRILGEAEPQVEVEQEVRQEEELEQEEGLKQEEGLAELAVERSERPTHTSVRYRRGSPEDCAKLRRKMRPSNTKTEEQTTK